MKKVLFSIISLLILCNISYGQEQWQIDIKEAADTEYGYALDGQSNCNGEIDMVIYAMQQAAAARAEALEHVEETELESADAVFEEATNVYAEGNTHKSLGDIDLGLATNPYKSTADNNWDNGDYSLACSAPDYKDYIHTEVIAHSAETKYSYALTDYESAMRLYDGAHDAYDAFIPD